MTPEDRIVAEFAALHRAGSAQLLAASRAALRDEDPVVEPYRLEMLAESGTFGPDSLGYDPKSDTATDLIEIKRSADQSTPYGGHHPSMASIRDQLRERPLRDPEAKRYWRDVRAAMPRSRRAERPHYFDDDCAVYGCAGLPHNLSRKTGLVCTGLPQPAAYYWFTDSWLPDGLEVDERTKLIVFGGNITGDIKALAAYYDSDVDPWYGDPAFHDRYTIVQHHDYLDRLAGHLDALEVTPQDRRLVANLAEVLWRGSSWAVTGTWSAAAHDLVPRPILDGRQRFAPWPCPCDRCKARR